LREEVDSHGTLEKEELTMLIDLEWDDAAYLLALLKKNPGIKARDRKIRKMLIWAMTKYDGNTSNRMSKDIGNRVEAWYAKLIRTDFEP
jgi:hypothetical protein